MCFRSMGLSFHRPSLSEYNVRILPQELQHIKSSRLILLIVPQHSRGIAIMALAAHLIGLRAKLVLCVQTLPDGCVASGEKVIFLILSFLFRIDHFYYATYTPEYPSLSSLLILPSVPLIWNFVKSLKFQRLQW